MNEMPKISIIMPVYNKQHYLTKSLDSVLDQAFSDFELIAIDDGSTDDSLQILEKHAAKDKRIRIIHTENLGVSHARNVGLDNVKGKYIQFLDSDDLIEKDYLYKCQTVLSDHDPDILFTSFHKTDEKGMDLGHIITPMEGCRDKNELQKDFLANQKKTGFYGFISNKLIRRILIEKNHVRFDEELKLAEDLDFFIQLYAKAERLYYLSEDSFKYVQTNENYSRESDIDYLKQLNIRKRIRQWIIDSGTYSEYKDAVDKPICQYAAYAVFDAAIKNKNINNVCETLLIDEIVCNCLNADYVTNKVHKRIVNSIQNKKTVELVRYLRTRERIKKLFGRNK